MSCDEQRIAELNEICVNMRRTILEIVYRAQSGHMGGSLSCVEILAALYLEKMNPRPFNLQDPNRDRFILSKGHAAPALYTMLAYIGLIPREELLSLRRLGSCLQGHPDMKGTPGVEMSSGPLGLGLSVAVGMALAARLDNLTYRTYVLLGDGEIQEGIIWEAAMAASKYALHNVTAILDYNGVQLDGTCNQIMPLRDVAAKFASFGWNVLECDGHSVTEIANAIDRAASCRQGPSLVIARTVKGKGVSFMEGQNAWHGKPVDEASYQRAATEIGGFSYAK